MINLDNPAFIKELTTVTRSRPALTLFPKCTFPFPRSEDILIKIPRRTIEDMEFWQAWQARSLERRLGTLLEGSPEARLNMAVTMTWKHAKPGSPIDTEKAKRDLRAAGTVRRQYLDSVMGSRYRTYWKLERSPRPNNPYVDRENRL